MIKLKSKYCLEKNITIETVSIVVKNHIINDKKTLHIV